MSTPTPTHPLVGGVGLLERATAYTLGSLLQVRPTDLGRHTPCHAWDLRQLLHHMNDSLTALHDAVDSGYIDLAPTTPEAQLEHIVDSLRASACRLVGAWTATQQRTVGVGDMSLTSSMVAAAGAVEIAVHGWDVSVACRQPRTIPPALAADLLDLSLVLVSSEDRPGRFAAPVPATRDAEPGEQLLGWLGRDVHAWPLD